MRQGNALPSPRSSRAEDVAVKKTSKQRSKKLDLTKPVERPRMPISVMVRMFLLGSVAIAASGYAIYRHYYVARPSMLVPASPPSDASWIDVDAGDLLLVPELVPELAPAGSPSSSP